MDELRSWVLTICGGTLICGIVSALVPGQSFVRPMRLLLGIFLFTCFLTPFSMELTLPQVDISAAEQQRQNIAVTIERRTEVQMEEELEQRACEQAALLLGEPAEPDDISATAYRQENGSLTLSLLLPEYARLRSAELCEKLSEQLGVAVTAQQPAG